MPAIIIAKDLIILEEGYNREVKASIGMLIRGVGERMIVIPLIDSVFPALNPALLIKDDLLPLALPDGSGMVYCLDYLRQNHALPELKVVVHKGEEYRVIHRVMYKTKDGRLESLHFPSFEAGERFCEAFREAAEDFYLNYPNYVKTIL